MAEFIGARISLVSRSDIRYVGTLHEIDSETSTVALENVSSFGTEGRKGNPADEIPASDSVYEYIVFRGSDVKDLRIEEAPAAKENKQPQMPNDPAILGSGSRPNTQSQQQRQQHGPHPGAPGFQQGPAMGGPPFPQHPQYPGFYPPPPQGWGRGGPPAPHGFPQMPPYGGGPPGWYPGPQQSFPPGPMLPYGGFPHEPPGQFPGRPQNQADKPAPIGPGANKQPVLPAAQHAEKLPETSAKPAEMPATAVEKPITPATATEVKPPASQPSTAHAAANAATTKVTPTGPKANNRVQPVIPLQSPASVKAPLQVNAANASVTNAATKQQDPSTSLRDATQAATAAVAAAMAKLPASGQANGSAVDNLQRKVNEMRVNSPIRAPRQPGGTNFGTGRSNRGSRGGPRGGAQKIEVPETDFDFALANAKFNKQDLVKEAIAGSPLGETAPAEEEEAEVPSNVYNKATSFFDNISSEAKERAEASSNGHARPGGREWRGEEQKKNVETFGQGSVDNGYRGGYRGRGRGRGGYRGRGYSGNGQPSRGRGGYRGRGDAQTIMQ